MNGLTLESRYFERMAKSLGDKMKIVEALPPVLPDYATKVLDVGAGGGEFAEALTELGYEVTALDASGDAIHRIHEKFPEIKTAQLYADEATELGVGYFDAVVCSSILHEVFSYGDHTHGPGSFEAVVAALNSFYKVLKTGGVLLIRDGVKSDNWDDKAMVKLLQRDTSPVTDYLKMCPFANGSLPAPLGTLVTLDNEGDWYYGNQQSVYEFYMTYNWGVDSYARETQELYGIYTLQEYVEVLTSVGFSVEDAHSWVQEGYETYLPQKVVLFTGVTYEKVNQWLPTNAFWIARKTA